MTESRAKSPEPEEPSRVESPKQESEPRERPEPGREVDEPETEIPTRELRDPRALRALAHPVRLRILEQLAVGGPATATELSELVGESPANCSWHLRQLAQHGFIEEAGGGTGRQRPWRFVLEGTSFGDPDEQPELARAGDAAAEVIFARDVELLRTWHASKRSEPAAWRMASFTRRSMTWLTSEELDAVGREIGAIQTRYLGRLTDPSRRPPGSRPVRLVAWGTPAREFPAEPEGQ